MEVFLVLLAVALLCVVVIRYASRRSPNVGKRATFRFEMPVRKPGEDDATDRQIAYIEQLLEEIGAEHFPVDPSSLGKWQASTVIDRLQSMRDGEIDDRISTR